ncbi:MAG: type III secretion system export apparatus subunit SctT [Candidatus Adiutrix sp.]|nr:type III secretion system export apparatus subunit SctT [Candidatus Adiutrix sp.]
MTAGLGRPLEAALLGLPRLGVFLAFSPFLGGNVLNSQIKAAVLMALYCFVHPIVLGQTPAGALFGRPLGAALGLLLKESFLGFILAYVSGLVFWAIQSAGFLMDNQRGASSASASDPLSGEETSPLGSFLFQFLVYIFLASHALTAFLALFFETYLFWPPAAWRPDLLSPDLALFIAGLAAQLMTQMCLLAAPVVLAALLVDVSLGLINRFASQLNVYVLAMPIKSGLAMFIVLMLLSRLADTAPGLFTGLTGDILHLKKIWP